MEGELVKGGELVKKYFCLVRFENIRKRAKIFRKFRPNLLRITQCGGGRGAYIEPIGGSKKVKLSTFLKRAGSGTKQPPTFRIEPEDPEGTLQAFFDANENVGGPFCVEYAQNFTPRQFTRIKGIHNFRLLYAFWIIMIDWTDGKK